jgi:anti-anti-sigma factor
MNFIIENKKDLTIFRIQEKRLDASLAPELKSQILMLVAEGKKYLIIDLAQVDTIDSSGIGALLIAHRHTAEHEGFAAFIGVHGNVKDLLQMMQLHKQLYIFSSVQEVLHNLEEVEETEEVKTKTVEEEEEEEEDIDPLPELDEVDLSAESDLALSEEQLDEASLDVSEFPDETAAEFSEAEEEKEELTPKKPAKTKKSAKVSKPSKASKPAKAKSAKAKSATAKKKSSPKAKSATAKKKSSPKAKSATAKKKSSSTVKSKKK